LALAVFPSTWPTSFFSPKSKVSLTKEQHETQISNFIRESAQLIGFIPLDLSGGNTLVNALDIDGGDVNLIRRNGAYGNDLLNFSNGGLSGSGHHGVKVAGCVTELKVTEGIGSPGLNKGKITTNGVLHEVLTAIEGAGLASLGFDGNSVVGAVLDWPATVLDVSSYSGNDEGEGRVFRIVERV
jgi:hypothetical protein